MEFVETRVDAELQERYDNEDQEAVQGLRSEMGEKRLW